MTDSITCSTIRRSESTPEIAKGMKRNVSFHKVEFREYGIVLGDNPSVQSGPPIQLDWEHEDEYETSIDDYEEKRGSRRARDEMLIPKAQREDILRYSGHSRKEIQQATKESFRAKVDRIHSANQGMLGQKVEEALQSTKRKISRLVVRKPKPIMDSKTGLRYCMSMNDLNKSHPSGILKDRSLMEAPIVETDCEESQESQDSNKSLPSAALQKLEEEVQLNNDGNASDDQSGDSNFF